MFYNDSIQFYNIEEKIIIKLFEGIIVQYHKLFLIVGRKGIRN